MSSRHNLRTYLLVDHYCAYFELLSKTYYNLLFYTPIMLLSGCCWYYLLLSHPQLLSQALSIGPLIFISMLYLTHRHTIANEQRQQQQTRLSWLIEQALTKRMQQQLQVQPTNIALQKINLTAQTLLHQHQRQALDRYQFEILEVCQNLVLAFWFSSISRDAGWLGIMACLGLINGGLLWLELGNNCLRLLRLKGRIDGDCLISHAPHQLLVGRTIRESFQLGHVVSEPKICDALAKVGMLQKVLSWPLGIDTPLGLEASYCSRGERQALEISLMLAQPDGPIVASPQLLYGLDAKQRQVVAEALQNSQKYV